MIDWIHDPLLQNMDPAKKLLFEQAAKQIEGKKGNAMASVMMALITSANRKGISFNSEEIALILKLMKEGKTKSEQQQIDNMVHMVTTMMKKHNR